MAVDIGTGVIRIEIDRAQLRREAAQTERFLARQRTALRPEINNRALANELRRGIRLANTGNVWRPLEQGGERAMRNVGERGVESLRRIERQGATSAARLRRAFAGIGLAQGGSSAQLAGAAISARGGGGIGALARGVGGSAVTGAVGNSFGRLFAANFGASALTQAGPIGSSFSQAFQGGLNPAVIAAALATAVVGVVATRFSRAGGFGSGAPGGALLEALGFRTAGRISAEGRFDTQASAIQELAGTSDDLSRARNRAARETDKTATQEQRARGEFERARRRNIEARRAETRNLRRRLITARVQRFFLDRSDRFGTGVASWFTRNFREPDLRAGLRTSREQLRDQRQQLRDVEFGGSRVRQFLGLRRTLVTPPSARETEQQQDRLRILNEQQIDAVADQADEYRRSTDLLRRQLRGDRVQRAELRRQRANYISVLRQRAVAERAAAIRERAVTSGFGTDLSLILGRSGLGLSGRISAFSESITNVAQRLAGWGVGIGILVGATYALARVTNAAVRRSEEVAAAQVAAATIAQRTLGAPTGEAVDIQEVTAGIRAGAQGGLSELQVYRTAIDAIRTGSSDIFLNTEQVLGDLRVVAAATGVAFEDATTRFFRGIIKREQELLDELGIVARVEAANQRYARSINVAASALSPFQQQLAFATEVQRQLTISAENFGRESVLSTQSASIAADNLTARYQNLFANIGADPFIQDAARQGVRLGHAFADAVEWLFTIENQQGNINRAQELQGANLRRINRLGEQQVDQVGNINRLEAVRNRVISERLGLIGPAALQGSLNVLQQQILSDTRGAVQRQQERIFFPGGLNTDQVSQASANLTELQGVIENLAESRSRTRIGSIQGPLAALLSSLEGGGRVARLSTEAYQDLTRGTAESEEAISLLAVAFNQTVPEVRAAIEANRQLDAERKKETESIQSILRRSTEALRFGPALREELANLSDAFTSPVIQLRELVDEASVVSDLSLGAAGIRERAPIARTPLELDLTVTDRLSLAASEVGLTLDTMSSNFSRFAEDLLFESNSIRDALQAFIRNIAQTVVRSQATNLGNELFGSLGLTNVGAGTGGGTTYNTFQNIGIANPLQARNAGFQAAALEGIGI